MPISLIGGKIDSHNQITRKQQELKPISLLFKKLEKKFPHLSVNELEQRVELLEQVQKRLLTKNNTQNDHDEYVREKSIMSYFLPSFIVSYFNNK